MAQTFGHGNILKDLIHKMWNLINTKSANEARAKGLTLVKDFVEGEYNIVSATNNNFCT